MTLTPAQQEDWIAQQRRRIAADLESQIAAAQSTISTLASLIATLQTSNAGKATQGELATVATTVPAFDTQDPMPEAGSPVIGARAKVPRGDHRHPRVSSVKGAAGPTDASGLASIIFTRTFSAPPGMILCAVEAGTASPPSFKITKWLTAAGADWVSGPIGGAQVYADRNRTLPTLSALALLTSVISTLSGYSTRIPATVSFTYVAIEAS